MFETIKNVAALIGAIGVLVALYRLYHGRLTIRAKGNFSNLRIPPAPQARILEFVKELSNATSDEKFDGEVKTKRLESLMAKWPEGVRTRLSGGLFAQDSFWEFEISNVGKVEVRELILELPFDGVYVINSEEQREFEKRISIGSLRAKETANIVVWADSFRVRSSRGQMHVTHSGGSVPVMVGHTIYGKSGALAKFLQEDRGYAALFAFQGVALLLAVFVLYVTIRQAAEPKGNEPIASPSATKPATPTSSQSQ